MSENDWPEHRSRVIEKLQELNDTVKDNTQTITDFKDYIHKRELMIEKRLTQVEASGKFYGSIFGSIGAILVSVVAYWVKKL